VIDAISSAAAIRDGGLTCLPAGHRPDEHCRQQHNCKQAVRKRSILPLGYFSCDVTCITRMNHWNVEMLALCILDSTRSTPAFGADSERSRYAYTPIARKLAGTLARLLTYEMNPGIAEPMSVPDHGGGLVAEGPQPDVTAEHMFGWRQFFRSLVLAGGQAQ